MATPLDRFSKIVRQKRAEREISQRNLAYKLDMSIRTIINIEKNRSNPKLETAFLLAQELDFSLDELVFDQRDASIPRCVSSFFAGMSDEEAQKYIDFCKSVKALNEQK